MPPAAGASTPAIARRAGVSQPYIYALFPSKKALFVAAHTRVVDRIRDRFASAAAGARDPGDALRRAGRSFLDTDREALRCQLQGYAASGDPEIRDHVRAEFTRLFDEVRAITGASRDEVALFTAGGMFLTVVGAHRRAEHLLEAVGVARMADVDEHDAAGCEVVAHLGEELARGQIERDVGLAVGVDDDDVPAARRGAQERARVGGVDVEVGPVHVEEAAADLGQGRVDLHAVHAGLREVVAVGARSRARRVAEDRHRARAPAAGERQHEHLVPVIVGEPLAGAVDRVHRKTLVELQTALAVGLLGHAGVLVVGLALPDHARAVGRLD